MTLLRAIRENQFAQAGLQDHLSERQDLRRNGLTGAISYFGNPSAKERIAADPAEHRLDLTARKEILWESETATDAEVRAVERHLIMDEDAAAFSVFFPMD